MNTIWNPIHHKYLRKIIDKIYQQQTTRLFLDADFIFISNPVQSIAIAEVRNVVFVIISEHPGTWIFLYEGTNLSQGKK